MLGRLADGATLTEEDAEAFFALFDEPAKKRITLAGR